RFEIQDAAVVTHDLLHQRHLEMQARTVVGTLFGAEAFDASELQQQRALSFLDHERAVDDDDDNDQREARRNDFHWSPSRWLRSVAAAAALGSALNLSTGRYRRFLPLVPSMILVLPASTDCIVSRYRRLRVTSGAALYCCSSRLKRCVSPVALAIC